MPPSDAHRSQHPIQCSHTLHICHACSRRPRSKSRPFDEIDIARALYSTPSTTKYGRTYVNCCQDDMRRSVPHSEAHDATAAARYPMLNERPLSTTTWSTCSMIYNTIVIFENRLCGHKISPRPASSRALCAALQRVPARPPAYAHPNATAAPRRRASTGQRHRPSVREHRRGWAICSFRC
jgi:hypothetical protein